MELKTFIKDTLIQIIEGVKEAQNATKDDKGKINPRQEFYGSEMHSKTVRTSKGQIIEMVDFDVAITTAEGSGIKGGAGIIIGPVVIGTKGETSEQNTSQNRIKFHIPISYPEAE